MKIDRSYGNYEKETYKPTPTVDAPMVKATQSTIEPATIKLSDTTQKNSPNTPSRHQKCRENCSH